GLVDQEQGRIVHQAARDLELALLPAAQRARGLPAPLPQYGEPLACAADQLVDTSGLTSVAPGAQPQVHLDGEERKDAGALREIDDAVPAHLVRPYGPQGLPVETDLSIPRGQKPEQHLQQRRFPGAVGTEDASDLSTPRLDRDAAEDVDARQVARHEVSR